jgi:aspartyl-tRNA(Asn)/glutamyl-tRNA(Gln) amidotransferase subunit A
VLALEWMGAAIEEFTIDFASHVEVFQTTWQTSLRSRLEEMIRKSGREVATSLAATIELGARHSAVDLAKAQQLRTTLYRDVEALFQRFDVIVTPVTARDALELSQDPMGPIEIDGRVAGTMRRDLYPYTWPFNLTGHPAISIPCGFSAAGLPLGFQLVGPWDHDERLLDIAGRLEAQRPWVQHRPNPTF